VSDRYLSCHKVQKGAAWMLAGPHSFQLQQGFNLKPSCCPCPVPGVQIVAHIQADLQDARQQLVAARLSTGVPHRLDVCVQGLMTTIKLALKLHCAQPLPHLHTAQKAIEHFTLAGSQIACEAEGAASSSAGMQGKGGVLALTRARPTVM